MVRDLINIDIDVSTLSASSTYADFFEVIATQLSTALETECVYTTFGTGNDTKPAVKIPTTGGYSQDHSWGFAITADHKPTDLLGSSSTYLSMGMYDGDGRILYSQFCARRKTSNSGECASQRTYSHDYTETSFQFDTRWLADYDFYTVSCGKGWSWADFYIMNVEKGDANQDILFCADVASGSGCFHVYYMNGSAVAFKQGSIGYFNDNTILSLQPFVIGDFSHDDIYLACDYDNNTLWDYTDYALLNEVQDPFREGVVVNGETYYVSMGAKTRSVSSSYTDATVHTLLKKNS